ncbi:hypothetical protein QFC20_006598 [Naganishia adeliensis]|uniref:Uncharacterized protein n=1 Tax=Naganishia adeliensis TaxID=92952 RepID=A0ACC2VA45_9TREE|nr:hypothetical protein QFC20_006598 [Naganishia adeliensis]
MDDPASVLLIILDFHPLSWAMSADPAASSDPLTIDRALNELLVFLNAHLACKWGNELVVYVAMAGGRSRPRWMEVDGGEGEDDDERHKPPPPNAHYSPTIKHPSIRNGPHNRSRGAAGSSGARARVLIVNNTPERGSGGYVGLMNSVFAAQKRVPTSEGEGEGEPGEGEPSVASVKKQGTVARSSITRMSRDLSKIPIDVINLHPTDSIFLQQAAHLTHGIYFKLPKRAAFLIYLNLIFLPPPHLRAEIGLPPQDKVDFRAVCFCHQRVVDIGTTTTQSPPGGAAEVAQGEWGDGEWGIERRDAGGG